MTNTLLQVAGYPKRPGTGWSSVYFTSLTPHIWELGETESHSMGKCASRLRLYCWRTQAPVHLAVLGLKISIGRLIESLLSQLAGKCQASQSFRSFGASFWISVRGSRRGTGCNRAGWWLTPCYGLVLRVSLSDQLSAEGYGGRRCARS